MRKIAVAITAAALLAATGAQAAPGDWLVRMRAVDIDPDSSSSAGGPAGLPADAISVSSRLAPEVDVSYFVTPHLALELILTYPQKHDVSLAGVGNIGSVKELPPTLTLQYHFAPEAKFRPYLGAGVNYTRFSSVNLSVPGIGALDVDKNSWGGALQAGFDFAVGKNTFVNLDVKKIWIDTQVKDTATGGGQVNNKLEVNPVVWGIGFGWKF